MNISDVAKKTGLTSKAIRFYEEKGLVRRVDGMASVEAVAAAIDAILDSPANRD